MNKFRFWGVSGVLAAAASLGACSEADYARWLDHLHGGHGGDGHDDHPVDAGVRDAGSKAALPPVKHVFVIVLENKNYADTFGTSTQNPYMTQTLKPMGALLTNYYGTGHVSLDNYVSMISGQSSSKQTESDCISFNDFVQTGTDDAGQAIGDSCVYPSGVKTLPDQLVAANLSWKGYMEDMGNDPARESSTCGHVALGAKDVTQSPEAPSTAVPNGDQYAGRHNPFLYFHSIIDDQDYCDAHVVNLDKLEDDLASIETTPNFVFITPNLCHDGHDGDGTGTAGKGCVNGEPGGLKSSDDFLKLWVPKILASEAYQKDGLLLVTFDESSYGSTTTKVDADAGTTEIDVTFSGEHCCGQQIGPNVTRPSSAVFPLSPTMSYVLNTVGYGGDRVGALVLSPFVAPGTVTDQEYNHYSMLRSVEDLFGLEHLGYAGQPGLVPFGTNVYTNY